ncbi:MAG: hypothetical protein JST71_08655 [Bacteroidetes bacterium]|nr:hypothetical protein [Bacteroidota bacterium]MBX7239513.1 hypothetical protein [Bacteroidia bacterium]MCC7513957.1 hypothetical protein [Bacteroidia bacterium]MCW5918954.1 hypothetical protein [Bacteroidota bacterium]HMU77930.1 hypothetical protein [Bacteroidia bacterium]
MFLQYLYARGDRYQFTGMDIFYSLFLLVFIFYFAKSIRDKHIEENPSYRYFLGGLMAKIVGGIMVVLVYTLYYSGGDTIYYFFDSMTMTNLLFKNFIHFGDVVINGWENYKFSYLDSTTGTFVYYRSPESFFIARILWPFTLVGLQQMVPTVMLLALVSFGGVWRMYQIFIMEFPKLERPLAYTFFFLPSVFFWGSGILKDSITLSALGYFFYSFYYVFIVPKKVFKNLVIVIISAWIIISIKAYIFIGVLPGALIWIVSKLTSKIRGGFIRKVTFPLIMIIVGLSGFLLLNTLSEELGKFKIDRLLDEAVVSNTDLQSDYYGGNSFSIGEIEPTVQSMLIHMPLAINAALFRPYITEARNVMMMVSGLENLFILLFTLYVLYKVKIIGIFKYFNKNSLLTFSLIFSLFFAFAVGISTSNFGSLVRYRIPLLPFYVSSLIIIRYLYEKEKTEKRELSYSYYKAITE